MNVRKPIIFLSEGQEVWGVYHRPARLLRPAPAVLILHGLVGSKDQPHQMFVKLANRLAEAGIIALRIDLRGRGESEGNLAVDVTPAGDLADVENALHWLVAQTDVDATQLGVMGLSWGGTVAILAAARDPRVGMLMLWNATAANIHQWNPPFADYNGQSGFDLFGNVVGKQFYDGLRPLRVQEALAHVRGPVFLLQSANDEAIAQPVAAAQRFADTLQQAGIDHTFTILPEADHALMRHAWEQAAIEQSVVWIQAAIDRGSGGLS
jgi:uncharacterized protein